MCPNFHSGPAIEEAHAVYIRKIRRPMSLSGWVNRITSIHPKHEKDNDITAPHPRSWRLEAFESWKVISLRCTRSHGIVTSFLLETTITKF
ncbi:hypothetical protein MLD38_032510 [Melastoma candidum]|uniref:Uncharacterized protein n=1 Tax=Melastoma candidum TaxID=119954 RepID=A0ACB9M424_9MYRT|nr:hypothetical protein MLD38_032510 [Melastoma candidum]